MRVLFWQALLAAVALHLLAILVYAVAKRQMSRPLTLEEDLPNLSAPIQKAPNRAHGPCFFPETGRFSRKTGKAIEHERAITERG